MTTSEWLASTKTEESYHAKLWEWLSTPEAQASHVVYQKYKRSLNLECTNLKQLQLIACILRCKREELGKKISIDYIVQELQKFITDKHPDQDQFNSLLTKYGLK